MFKKLSELETTLPSKTEYGYLSQLLSIINNNKNVLIIGANGTGNLF
ncbi:hypothetical protein MHK_008797 [Candidatus Magnetomorum sp. HK-1]|nr:hypothetical protein MHK_008797 [Candidatus Magnetomorum sp. HK-1]